LSCLLRLYEIHPPESVLLLMRKNHTPRVITS
jgi:hypothetical protein